MAAILTNYNLAGGNTSSSEVVSPNNWRVTAKTSGCPTTQRIEVKLFVKDSAGDEAPLVDEQGRHIKLDIAGNDKKSINVISVNAPVGLVKVDAKAGSSGLITIDSINV